MYIYIYIYVYIYIYRNAQIGFTSRGLIDVYAAIAPMVERNPIRRAIRESKRSSNASFVESLWLSSLPPSSVPLYDDSFFRSSATAELPRRVYYRNFRIERRNPWDDFNSLVSIRSNVRDLPKSATLRSVAIKERCKRYSGRRRMSE